MRNLYRSKPRTSGNVHVEKKNEDENNKQMSVISVARVRPAVPGLSLALDLRFFTDSTGTRCAILLL